MTLALTACAGDDDETGGSAGSAGNGGNAGNAGNAGTTGGMGSSGTGSSGNGGVGGGDGDGDGDGDVDGGGNGDGGVVGTCDDRGCWVTLAAFQAEALNCETTYEMAQSEYEKKPGEDCSSAFFECGGLRGAAYQYGPTGDNVQCYYDDDGALVGGVRTSDHGQSTMTGQVPNPGCYAGPDCDVGGEIPGLRACQVPSDCVIVETSCCPCGQPEPSGVTAVAFDRRAQFKAAQCGESVGCPPVYCAPEPPRFVPTCDAGTCAVIDLFEQAALECQAPEDCHVRAAACCECNAPTSRGALLAVSDGAAFASLVCDPEQACNECGAIYPSEVTATCSTSGLCELQDPRE